jgi:PadR family transcriptional regulator PadR
MGRKRRRLSDPAAAVLGLFVLEPHRGQFGAGIIEQTEIPSGSLYPILHRFEKDGVLTSSWEDFDVAIAERRRPRKLYRLRPGSEEAATRLLREWEAAHGKRTVSIPHPRTA